MNIVKVAVGCEHVSSGSLGVVTVSTPIVEQVRATKQSLEAEEAKPLKKYAFMTGHVLLGVLEHWKILQPDVMKVVKGGKEIIQGFKEAGLSLEQLMKEKERISNEQKEACQVLLNPPVQQPVPNKGKGATTVEPAGTIEPDPQTP